MFDDGRYTICLSTRGTNDKEVPKELISFLQYVKDGPNGNHKNYDSKLVKEYQQSVHRIKMDRDLERRYMRFQDIIHEEKLDLIKEIIIEDLSELGNIPSDLKSIIMDERELDKLKSIIRFSSRCQSIEEFISSIKNI